MCGPWTLQVTRLWGISLLGTNDIGFTFCIATFDEAKGDAKGFTGDMDKMPSRCLYATDSTGRLLYCGVLLPVDVLKYPFFCMYAVYDYSPDGFPGYGHRGFSLGMKIQTFTL